MWQNKEEKEMLTKKQKEILKQFVKNTCETCHKKFESQDLRVHHINRHYLGGLDNFRNLQVNCTNCHKLIHFKEFR